MHNDDKPKTTDELLLELNNNLADINTILGRISDSASLRKVRVKWPDLEETITNAHRDHSHPVDISTIADKLKSLGINASKPALTFIKDYDGLTVDFPDSCEGETIRYIFDAVSAAKSYSFQEEHEQQIGRAVCPVAQSNDSMAILLIDDIGRVFASLDSKLAFIASTPAEAMITLNRNNPFKQFPLLDEG